MPSILSLAAAILAMLGGSTGTTPSDKPEAHAANADVVYAASPAGANGLWNNVRFGLPRVPRPPAAPGW
jgi:hypothetical protein